MDSKTSLEQINVFKRHFHFLHLMNVRCEVYLKQHYVNKLVSDSRHVVGFSPVSYNHKTDRHDITEILLKVASITINQTKPFNEYCI